MASHARAVIAVFVLLTLLCGVAYPLAVTLVAQLVFPHHANGSLIDRDGTTIGSDLIGQQFDDPRYFWGRPSALTPPYTSTNSGGSNLGPTNPELHKAVAARIAAMRKAHPDQTGPVPVDLVTASASGLDPHISPAAAEYQLNRVAKARSMSNDSVRELVARHSAGRTIGILGEPRVNVLRLNLELDRLGKAAEQHSPN